MWSLEIQAYSGLDPGTVDGSTCIYTEHIEIHSFTQLSHTCYVYIMYVAHLKTRRGKGSLRYVTISAHRAWLLM